MAAVLACGDGAALSHFSAAVLWGMLQRSGRRDPRDGRRAEAAARARGARGGAGEASGHGGPASPSRRRRAPSSTSPTWPRGRTLERAIDEAEYLRLDCTGLAPRHGRRGSGRLASVLAVHTAGSTRTRSELEEMFLALCDQHGLPRPEVNVHVEGYECDFVWREQRADRRDRRRRRARHDRAAMRRDPVRDARSDDRGLACLAADLRAAVA